jgi:hypothetical protein
MTETTAPTAIERAAATVENVKAFDPGLGAYSFESLGEAVRFSDLMARADVMLPAHLRMKPALCLAVTMRAIHWKFDPFALAGETYQAKDGGQIGYQAKVFVAALRNVRGVRLKFRYEGNFTFTDKPVTSAKGHQIAPRGAVGDLRCIAYATVDGEVLEYETPTLDQIAVKNSPGWHNTPRDQIAYFAGRGWVRMFDPGVMMGAYSDDEVESMGTPIRDVTPAEPKRDTFAAIAEKARANEAAEVHDTEDAEEAEQAEEGEEPDHWTEGFDPVSAIPGSKEWKWGEESAQDPENTPRACPFERDTQEAHDWLGGFIGKRRAME